MLRYTILILFVSFESLCQTTNTRDSLWSYFVESKYQHGYVLINNSKLSKLNIQNPNIIQADFSILKNEQRIWDYCGCFTKNGVSLSYTDLGNTRSLGYAANILFFTEPFIIWSRRIQLSLHNGAGLAYTNIIYNKTTNPNNIAISKHLSFLLTINPNIYLRLTQRARLNIGVQINHISNGGTRWPNWGYNYLTTGIGLEYMLKPQTLNRHNTTPFTNRSIKYIVHIFGGSHHSDPHDKWIETSRFVGGINVGVLKPLGRINAFGVGGEIYYDGISTVLQSQSGEKYHNVIGSISLQHYFTLGKIIFGQQLAYYVTPPNPNVQSNIYQRYFLEYKIKDKLYGGVSLRSHGQISDYITLSTGYIF
jgi:hypothetical protein